MSVIVSQVKNSKYGTTADNTGKVIPLITAEDDKSNIKCQIYISVKEMLHIVRGLLLGPACYYNGHSG